jgi:putative acetyltransferase
MINLRKAEKKDESSIMYLVTSVLSDYGLKTNLNKTDIDLSNIDNYYFKTNGWFAVLEDNGQIIGSYGLIKISESICELRKMYLLNNYQG